MEDIKILNHEEIVQVLIELLKEFVEFCDKENLCYYLAYGTALGAVRHNGMIPWDDDIDVCMPREDYDKLRAFHDKKSVKFDVLTYPETPDYVNYFAKISDRSTRIQYEYMTDCGQLGAFIDVFPMDEIKASENEAIKIEHRIKYIIKMLKMSSMNKYWGSPKWYKNIMKRVIYQYAKFRGLDYWQDKLRMTIALYQTESVGEKRYIIGWDVISKDVFGNNQWLNYEGMQLRVPEKTDLYLRKLYGDYMKLPKEEDRVSVHDYVVIKR